MSTPIGFVILVNPFSPIEQAGRLIGTLNRMFNFPPMACHFDLGKNPTLPADRSANLRMVRPHLNTRWADFSCIEAAVAALRLLYHGGEGPDWFVYLSGADYPIKPAARILADLQNSSFDAHIEHRLVALDAETPLNPDHPEGYKGPGWLRHCHRLYCSRRIRSPWLTRQLSPSWKTLWLEQRIFTAGHLPFDEKFQCYAGEAWFCANRRSARAILEFYDQDRKLARHYRKVLVPEESYFQTVLANAPDLRLSQDHFRYIDWTGGGSNPKLLTEEDFPRIERSTAHFARKVSAEPSDLMRQQQKDWTD